MDNYVITIARGFGSGGKHIGMALSKRLDIPCYDCKYPIWAHPQKQLYFDIKSVTIHIER